MRLATIRTGDGTHAVRVDGDTLIELDARDVGDLLRAGSAVGMLEGVPTGVEHDLDTADFAPVVLDPGKIICLGLNYEEHILEMGRELPHYPTLFAKYTEALIGARDAIVLPRVSDAVDWEVELALVIGQSVRHASAEEAADAIAGFTVANDISMRDYQTRTIEFLQGKTFEHSTPVGPWLVSPDEVGGVRPDLVVRCEVDDVLRQHSRTGKLVFTAVDVVQYMSDIVTLHPGDLILTGTPGGVGFGMDPPVYLQPGQVVRTTIEGIGELVNECAAEAAT
jgi:acylpyruvate hydrolase